jgi:hypothetical protein
MHLLQTHRPLSADFLSIGQSCFTGKAGMLIRPAQPTLDVEDSEAFPGKH